MAGQGFACRFSVSLRMVAAASAVGLAAGLVAGLAVPRESGLAPARSVLPGARARLTAWGAASASALAASAGQPVEVLSDRTDYAQTFADPNGGFTLDESVSPVRVQRPDGSWVPVDPTLARQPDGSYAPAAITTGLKLSGGGAGPLYTLSQGGASLAVSWPGGPLPAPSVSGATATYPNVLPGVNLLVSAAPTGVSELLQVTSAAAAASPALARLAFPVSAQGLSLSADGSGVLSAADGSGAVVFSAPPPQMWDSAGSQAPGGPAAGVMPPAAAGAGAAGPVAGDHVAVVPVTASAGSISLAPPASVLSGASTVYPVYIDPEVNTQAPNSWSDVAKNGIGQTWGDWEYKNSTYGGIRAGVECDPSYSNGSCVYGLGSTWITYRSYLNFNIPSSIWDSGFVDAQLQTNMEWAWACSPGTQVNLYYTDKAKQGMTWPGPNEKQLLDHSTKAYRSGDSNCNANGVNFNATGAAQAAANSHDSSVTLELRANNYDESNWNVYSWRRFAESSLNLQIDYRHAPDQPTSPVTDNVFNPATGQFYNHCAASAPGDYVNAPAPTMQATDDDSRDYQSGVPVGQITAEFSWADVTSGGSSTFRANGPYQPPPYTFQATWPSSVSNGDTFKWQAYGETEQYTDGIGNGVPHLTGPSTSWCYFTDDTSPPTAPAVITSVPDASGKTYTSGQAVNAPGTPAVFQLTDPTNADPLDHANDVAGYYYGLSPSPSIYAPAGTDVSRTATVTITPFSTAELDLYVQPVDRAGNPGAVSGPFRIDTVASGNIATLAWWKLNSVSGGTAADSTGDGNAATLSAQGASQTCGNSPPVGYSCSLLLDGKTGQADTTLPVAGNNGAFTVSAWVYLTSAGSANQAAISQAGTNTSGFTLGYAGSCKCWAFSMPASDSTSATVYQATAAATTGTWTQLTGVFDPAAVNPNPGCTPGVNCIGALSLYVNGVLAGQYWGAQPWSAPAAGVLRLGADGAGTAQDFWGGQLSDACAFYNALASLDVKALWAGGTGDGCAALYTKYP
jgi:hypothetical protein